MSSGPLAIPVPEHLAVLGPLFLSWPIAPISRCDLGPYHSGMENQPIRGLDGLFRRCAPFFFHSTSTGVLRIISQMADGWSCLSCILEREEEEFQMAIRAEVGATPPCTVNLSKIEFLLYLLMLILSPSIQKGKSQSFELDLF